MTEQEFKEALRKKGIELTDEQMRQFDAYYHLLVDWNTRMNLTAITDKEDVYGKHFYDSITACDYIDVSNVRSVVDVGAGAGFPSIPIKIVFPHLEVTIIDSLNKRITFLHTLSDALSLSGVQAIHSRAEEAGRKSEYRDRFDVAISRAVARMPVLTELCMPFVKPGGTFLAMKGSQGMEELAESKKAIQALGGKLKQSFTFALPGDDGDRVMLLIDKISNTPKKYPRKPGTPNKDPL